MDTNEITEKLKDCKDFYGVWPRDALPLLKERPAFIIVNTDGKDEPGEHWIAIMLNKDGVGEYMDSFGLPPLHPHLRRYMNKMCDRHWCYSIRDIQDHTSTKCGDFCIAYIKQRQSGKSLDQFINLFSNNKQNNDVVATKYS